MPKPHNMMITHIPLTGARLKEPLDPMQRGMPSPDSMLATRKFKPKSGGPSYTIIHTTETDSYDKVPPALARLRAAKKPPSAEDLAAALKVAAPTSDNFAGTARKAAKLSIAKASVENFADLAGLVKSLTPDASMIHHKPAVTTSSTSNRVKEEQRNVHLKAFLYAASRESDNDFHIIVGRDPMLTPALYMNMEVSGLPPQNAASFDALNTSRNSFKQQFGNNLPGPTYDFYNPPIPVEIEGSLFFDMTHASGQHPGPPSLKSRMPTIWEVHPITSIKF